MDTNNYIELLEQSYKKLKSSIYFDKTQLILRDKIVQLEAENSIQTIIEDMANKIETKNWEDLFIPILDSITYISFPKSLSPSPEKSNTSMNPNAATLITNMQNKVISVEDMQYFIDMDIKGYILGIAWILTAGYLIDSNVYEHSYGNRLRKNLLDKESHTPTYSPYLFEPYFQQYESWRDNALEYAKKSLAKQQDVVVLTLDFQRFFYQVNITASALRNAMAKITENTELTYPELAKQLTNFVGNVIETYSNKLRSEFKSIGNRNILPIGFHPSNILSNLCLKKFDDAMINGWNPLYYGRYVDDIIIVDKVEKNSWVYKQAQEETLSAEDMINYYLLCSDAWKRILPQKAKKKRHGLLTKYENGELESKYMVYKDFAEFPGSQIIVQNQKVKFFYFNSMQSDALLDCFQNKLRANKSEFRFLPEDESIFQNDDYSEIYALIEKDGPNKLRGVENISIDKFQLSKFLGKFMRISGLVIDNREKKFEKDIDKIFNYKTIIENYAAWEKVIAILANNENFHAIECFVEKALFAISKINCESGNIATLKLTLVKFLLSAINKSLSIIWGPNVYTLIKNIQKLFDSIHLSPIPDISYHINNMRKNYCLTRMCDKYSLSVLIDGFIDSNGTVNLHDNIALNLSRFTDILQAPYNYNYMFCKQTEHYIFYPYLLTMDDLTLNNVLRNMHSNIDVSLFTDIDMLKNLYVSINYHSEATAKSALIPIEGRAFKGSSNSCIKVGTEQKSKIKVAVANTILYESDFENVLKGFPNRSYTRYNAVMKVVNAAIHNKADILIMPESFLPFEWIPLLSRTCAKNQMAIVTGIEHLKIKRDQGNHVVYNLTAVILPFIEESYKFSYIHFHSKTHFSPDEKDTIISYRCTPQEGDAYELFCWNDFWFPVYCCYELASIRDRAIFQSYADAIVAVEWNKDTKYYSNIVEALSRDLHCFCIQVNTAKYGDSRITQPAKSEEKDILNVKGGINPTVLIDSIDIAGLREFQLKGNVLQSKSKQDKIYKPTPPDFEYEIVQKKIDGKLWEDLAKE